MEFMSSALEALKPSLDDDFVDRLNYYYSPSMILMFALVISAKQWVGQPIECWVPAQFTGAWEQYTEDYCFVQNTYWLPLREVIPLSYYERERRQIGYYQWVPFILAFQALFFYFPYMIWRLMNWQTGIDIHGICAEVETATKMEPEDQTRFIGSLTAFIKEILKAEKEIGNRCVFDLWQIAATHYGFYIVLLQFFMKILFICNSIGQIFFMNAILGNHEMSTNNGFWTFFNLLRGAEWEETGVFPRITMCDFEVRVLGNLHRYTVQCVLMINMFNEKIYLCLWYWANIISIFNIINLLYWLSLSLNPRERVRYINSFIRTHTDSDPQDQSEDRCRKKFVLHFLRQDGVLLIRKIATHASATIAVRLTRCLYDDFKEQKMRKRWNKLNPTDSKAIQTELREEKRWLNQLLQQGPDFGADAAEKEVETSAPPSSLSLLNPFRSRKLHKIPKARHL